MIKSQILKDIGLKAAVGDKYLEQLQTAGYVQIKEEIWGKERFRIRVKVTPKGVQRFEWFIKLSSELEI